MGFATRVWYAAGRTAELLYGRTGAVRARAGRMGAGDLENWDGTDTSVSHCFVPLSSRLRAR
jgi:hypothetical protein